MKNEEIHTIFFDVGGVCLTNGWDETSREKAAERFSLDFDHTESLHNELFEDLERGKLTLEDYIDAVYFQKKREFSREDILRFMKDQSRRHDSTFEILKRLKQEGKYRLSTINNESFVLNRFRIEKFGLSQYFSHFFSSSYLHMRKPEPGIYQAVLHITSLEPGQCLYIDDREENIAAAREEGMHCIHLPVVDELEKKLRNINII